MPGQTLAMRFASAAGVLVFARLVTPSNAATFRTWQISPSAPHARRYHSGLVDLSRFGFSVNKLSVAEMLQCYVVAILVSGQCEDGTTVTGESSTLSAWWYHT